MKKLVKTGLLIISLLAVAALLFGCGQTADNGAERKGNDEYLSEAANDSDYGAPALNDSEKAATTAQQVTANRKIIEYIDLTVETKAFDKLIADINATVKKSGGYIESSEVGGNSYYDSDKRTAELKIRIPKSKQSDFSDFMAANSNVVNNTVSTEDVTDTYIDTQSRIKALTLEKETLEKLLTQSTTMSDTLTVYERLTNVIAEIESYQGRLNQLDNLVEYTTFTVSIEEVEKETNVVKQNWFVKTWNGLKDNFVSVGKGLLSFLSFMIVALPYWILIAVIPVAIILIIRGIKRRRAKRRK